MPDAFGAERRSLLILLCIALDQFSSDDVDALSLLACTADLVHAQRMRQPMDRLRTLAGRALLRYGLSSFFGLKRVEVVRDEYGRPFLRDYLAPNFNISHSGGWAVCLIGARDQIGVDVEQIRPFYSEVVGFFSKSETELIARLDPEERRKTFFRLWTAKEAYIKALGNTFHTPLNRCRFSFTDTEITLDDHCAADSSNWHFFSGMLDRDHRYTGCYSGMETKPKMKIVTIGDLLEPISTPAFLRESS